MNLFGAATSGIDPQTGSYLSKEQRLAMFQASRGNGGVGGGANNGAQRAQVAPQNAIVVANKFAEITQSLSKNYESASAGVAQQVEENRKSIENIYRLIEAQRKDTLKAEKAETRSTLVQAENKRRNLKENFIEGISGAAAAAVAPLQKAAAAATKPLMSLWDRIRNALLLLAGAWAIDNLPEIIKKFNNYFGDLDKLKSTVIKALTGLRGVFSIFDGIIRSVTRIIGGIVKTAFRVGKSIVISATRIAGAVFGAIKKVVTTVVDAIFGGIRKLVGGAVNLYNKIRGMIPGGNKPTLPGNKPPQNIFQKFMGRVSKTFNGMKDFTGKQIGKMKAGADKFMTGFKDLGSRAMDKINPIKAYATKEGIEAGTDASRVKGLKSLLGKVFEKAGIAGAGILKNVGKLAKGILTRIPLIGPAIDIFLNKASGQGTGEAIIRGLASGIAGMVGLKAGAAIGAGVGTVAIPIPGVGTAVGGLLGGLIGSILAGSGADALAKAGMESAGMETTSNEQMSANVAPIVESTLGSNKTGTAGQPSPAAAITPSTPSTPDGMQTPIESNMTNNVNVQQLPATMEKIESKKEEVLPEQNPPAISTRDPQTDIYRAIAGKNYQLTLEGAF
jgi:hypothetical protein